jgi:hypothetical protein
MPRLPSQGVELSRLRASFTDGVPVFQPVLGRSSPAPRQNGRLAKVECQASPSWLEYPPGADELIGLSGQGAPPWPREAPNAGWPQYSPLMWRVLAADRGGLLGLVRPQSN